MNALVGDQTLIVGVLLLTVALFLWGRWRHDMVAVAALLICVLTGLVPATAAFSGFGHPAVISVACVLVLSRGLQTSGAVDVLTRHVLPKKAGPMASMAALIGLGAVLSGFMNNVGAMALLMPIAIQRAQQLDLTPGQVLMPLAFGTILGGMTTLIGTPPNLIVAGFRAQTGLGSFHMFDFTPIGLAVAFVGVLLSMVARTVPPRAVYDAIDWPVIVLLAALLPVAGVMESSGAADLIARFFLDRVAQGNAVVGLALILIVTMFLSDLMNNAATAAVMCPIALGTATALRVSPDAYLMAVAIGASCAFLTPIGHQNNTLILGPGGFRFGDYWRLGLPLEVLVAAVSIPMLLVVWPL